MTAITELAAPLPDMKVSGLGPSDYDIELRLFGAGTSMFPISIPITGSTGRPRWSLRDLPRNRRVIVTGYHGTGNDPI